MKKYFISILLIFASLYSFSEGNRIHDYGNSPTCGFQLSALGGIGGAGNDTYGYGFGILGDVGLRFDIKPANKVYLLEAKDGPEVYVRNLFGIFTFIKLSTNGFDYSDENTSGSISDKDKIVGGGLHLEIPIVTEDYNDTFARGVFIEPSIGYDFNDKQIKLEIFPGINIGTGKMWKQLHFQMQIGFDYKCTLSEDSKDFVSKSYMLVLGCKFLHDFNHSKYLKIIEDYNDEILAEKLHQAQKLEAQRRVEQERQKQEQVERQKLINSYKENYTVYGEYLFPKIYGKSADVVSLRASHSNFVKNVPFGFRNDVYYSISEDAGEVLQWIDRETCLFNFKEQERSYSYYGYSSIGKIYTGLAYVHFDSLVTSYPFDKLGVLYVYTGVYNYITAMGAQNTIPKFEAVYNIGTLPQ